jgi:hypothetical protein
VVFLDLEDEVEDFYDLIVKYIVHFVLSHQLQQPFKEGALWYYSLDVEEVELNQKEERLYQFDFAHTDGGATPTQQINLVDCL